MTILTRSALLHNILFKMLRFLTKSVNKYSFSSFKTAQKSLLGVSASEQSSATGHQKIDEKTADIQITKLPNGIRVVT